MRIKETSCVTIILGNSLLLLPRLSLMSTSIVENTSFDYDYVLQTKALRQELERDAPRHVLHKQDLRPSEIPRRQLQLETLTGDAHV